MIAPDALIEELMGYCWKTFWKTRPEKSWHTQKTLLKEALTYPAKWLDERKVPLPAERYREVVISILQTAASHGEIGDVEWLARYLYTCIQRHMQYHGDTYYAEGKSIRNGVSLALGAVERMKKGDDSTITILAQAHAVLAVGKRKAKTLERGYVPLPPSSSTSQPDLL